MYFTPSLFSLVLIQLQLSLNAVDLISSGELLNSYDSHIRGADQCLYLFDNDGVLKPVDRSATNEEHQTAREILTALASDDKNEVWVISARTLEELKEQYRDIPRLNLAGKVGAESQEYGKEVQQNYADLASPTKTMAKDLELIASEQDLTVHPSGSIIFHHRGISNSYTENVLSKMKHLAEGSDFDYANYPTLAALTHERGNKGRLSSTLLEKYTQRSHFVMSLGDTQADDSMFRALGQHSEKNPNAKTLSVVVGSEPLSADRRLQGWQEVHNFFYKLLRL